MEYKTEKKSLQITTQLFIDDVELLLQQKDPSIRLFPDSNPSEIDRLLELEFNNALQIHIDQKQLKYDYVGREYKNDVIQCYLEIELLNPIQKLKVSNKMLFNLFYDQQNIIHFKNKTFRKSFLLRSDNDSVEISNME
jgi:phosphoribosylanthranilate isomerase